MEGDRRTAVIDLGSSSFRLVVFTASPAGWWQRTDELYDVVRIGAGLDRTGRLAEPAVERALRALELYAHFCRAESIAPERLAPVATSAIREAANRDDFLERVSERTGLAVRVLSREQEAFYGYLAAVNSTTLRDGAALDLGGGSLQLTGVAERRAGAVGSWPLGAVRMTERFLPERKASPKQLRALREHVARELGDGPWRGCGGRLTGIGGTLRTLATAAQKAAGHPTHGVQGFRLRRGALDALVEELADRPADRRAELPGIKPERADVILAGAAVIASVVELGGFEEIEVSEAGLREGVFWAGHLAPADPPLQERVREASVTNLAARYPTDPDHVRHTAHLALEIFDGLTAAGLHAGDPTERELLWAAAMLHDIGMTVDYDDHHKHSRYLVLNAHLWGYTPRERALIAQMTRYHRKGSPSLGHVAAPVARAGDGSLLARCAAVLRLAEQLERSRDQAVSDAQVARAHGRVELRLRGPGDLALARWAAERHVDVFERAFGERLEIVAAP